MPNYRSKFIWHDLCKVNPDQVKVSIGKQHMKTIRYSIPHYVPQSSLTEGIVLLKLFRCKAACFLFQLACFYFTTAGAAFAGNPTLITFDDLPEPSGPYYGAAIPTLYDGLQWSNFWYEDSVDLLKTYGPSGYSYGMVSTNDVAFNAAGNPASLSSGRAFDLDSAYLTGAWNDGLHVEVQGFADNTLAYDNTYIVNSTAPTLINFNYLGVSSVEFISSGGTRHGYTGAGTQFVMDDLTITFVPEPSTLALGTLGALTLSWLRKGWLRPPLKLSPAFRSGTA